MRALVLIDIQNDFCNGGALAVPDADAVVPVANRLSILFTDKVLPVIATRDYHPQRHVSFASNHSGSKPGDLMMIDGLEQRLWPDHCVEGTRGCQFHPLLDISRITRAFLKGTNPRVDSYSGFFDNDKRRETGLDEYLHRLGVDELWMLGLATDYCVKYTALDARSLGYRVNIVVPGCRAIDAQLGDGAKALDEMAAAGCAVLDELPEEL